jgi:hypothetical protein
LVFSCKSSRLESALRRENLNMGRMLVQDKFFNNYQKVVANKA